VLRKLGRKVEDGEEESERMKGVMRAGRDGFEWAPDVKALAEAEQREGESGEVKDIDKREVKVVDLRKHYEGEFVVSSREGIKFEADLTAWFIHVDVFTFPKSIGLATKLEMMSNMELLFQELDAPLEQMVTP